MTKRTYNLMCKYCHIIFTSFGPLYPFCCIECCFHGNYIIDSTTDCWNWIGQIRHNDMGMFYFNRKKYSAPRYIYEKIKGNISKYMVLTHNCQNKRCVNPEHLFIKLKRDNLDKYRELMPPKNKISDPEMIEKIILDKRSYEKIAREYKVSSTLIWRLKNKIVRSSSKI